MKLNIPLNIDVPLACVVTLVEDTSSENIFTEQSKTVYISMNKPKNMMIVIPLTILFIFSSSELIDSVAGG